MTPEQRHRLKDLCNKIEHEADRKEFVKLVYELNVLLEEVQDTLVAEAKSDGQPSK